MLHNWKFQVVATFVLACLMIIGSGVLADSPRVSDRAWPSVGLTLWDARIQYNRHEIYLALPAGMSLEEVDHVIADFVRDYQGYD